MPHHDHPALSSLTIARYACAQCWGPLVEKYDQVLAVYVIGCPRGCQPGGFVSLRHVAERQAASQAEYLAVLAAYPFLEPAPTLPEAERPAARRALFGE